MTSNPVNSDRVDALIEYAKACSKPWISVEVVACLEELLDYRVNHAECSVTVETSEIRAGRPREAHEGEVACSPSETDECRCQAGDVLANGNCKTCGKPVDPILPDGGYPR